MVQVNLSAAVEEFVRRTEATPHGPLALAGILAGAVILSPFWFFGLSVCYRTRSPRQRLTLQKVRFALNRRRPIFTPTHVVSHETLSVPKTRLAAWAVWDLRRADPRFEGLVLVLVYRSAD